jgi:hypothetical protein
MSVDSGFLYVPSTPSRKSQQLPGFECPTKSSTSNDFNGGALKFPNKSKQSAEQKIVQLVLAFIDDSIDPRTKRELESFQGKNLQKAIAESYMSWKKKETKGASCTETKENKIQDDFVLLAGTHDEDGFVLIEDEFAQC